MGNKKSLTADKPFLIGPARRRAVLAIMAKDIREVLHSPMTLAPMVIVPLIFTVLLPAGLVLLFRYIPRLEMNGVEQLAGLAALYPVPADLLSLPEQFLWIFLNHTFVPLFLLIPLMTTIIIAANGIVGEREHKTLETLLSTPLRHQDFLLGKLLAALVPAVVLAWGGWILYALSANVASLASGGSPVVTSLVWIPVLLALVPAVTALGLAFTLLVSLKAKTFVEAQQLSAMVVLPVMLLLPVQMTGLLVFNVPVMLALAALLMAVALGLLKFTAPGMRREAVINRL